MSFIANNPLSAPMIEDAPSTPPGTRGLFAKKDGWYEVDDQGHVKKMGDSSGEEGVGRIGEGKNSIIFNDYENNKAISDFSVASGSNTIAGIKGYYYSNIDFSGERPVITLTKEQGVEPEESFIVKYMPGDFFSINNGSKFYNCSTIYEVNRNKITVDELPFEEVVWGTDYDDNTFYVIHRPLDGHCLFGKYANAEGEGSQALEKASHAEGYYCISYGQYSHTEGVLCEAAYSSHAEGYKTSAPGFYSHAEGMNTTASGKHGSHAEGYGTIASGEYGSHAEGYYTRASGKHSHAEGDKTYAIGDNSHSEGEGTYASSYCQHVQGKYNILDEDNVYAHIVGNGIPTKRSNAHTLDWNGNAWYAGEVTVGADRKRLITESEVETKLAAMVDSAPETLNTLNELALALGDDPNFATTITTELGRKANKADIPIVDDEIDGNFESTNAISNRAVALEFENLITGYLEDRFHSLENRVGNAEASISNFTAELNAALQEIIALQEDAMTPDGDEVKY